MKHKLKFLRGIIEVKAEDGKITVVASDETLDRHGDVLPIDQWDLTKFISAPRMLVDHDHQVSSIVGKWLNPRIQGKQLLMDADFHGITDLSKAVQKMVQDGYLNTVSVGFIPHGPSEDGGREVFELLETSWVTVPANPNAQIQASLKAILDKKVEDADTAKIQAYLGKEGDEETIDAEQDDDKIDGTEPDAGDEGSVIEPTELQAMAADPVKSIESFNKLAKKEGVVVCDYGFLSNLIADSVKLGELTAAGKIAKKASRDAQLIKLSIREAATLINRSLAALNVRD